MADAETSCLFAAVSGDFSWARDMVKVCVKLHTKETCRMDFSKKKKEMAFRRQYGSG